MDRAPHVLQCYQTDESVLTEKAVEFLRQGLEQDCALVIIATPEHRTALMRGLKSTGAMSRRGAPTPTIVLLDAALTLDRVLVDGEPDAARFDAAVGTSMRSVAGGGSVGGVYAYGDMIGLLWQARRFSAARRLEQLWNGLQDELGFALFCGFPIDILGDQSHVVARAEAQGKSALQKAL